MMQCVGSKYSMTDMQCSIAEGALCQQRTPVAVILCLKD